MSGGGVYPELSGSTLKVVACVVINGAEQKNMRLSDLGAQDCNDTTTNQRTSGAIGSWRGKAGTLSLEI